MRTFHERDIDNLSAILDYCDRVETIYRQIDQSYDAYREDGLCRDALLMNILQIGEAANRLSDECKETLGNLPWGDIIGTRNVIVHGYKQIDDQIIWNVIEKDVPILKEQIEKAID